ncbi:hypothetical protein J6590_035071 [Homalodisca vitripennis]|nr:hypothetical protein J6590_035071 [Homalodisca vitripennis]
MLILFIITSHVSPHLFIELQRVASIPPVDIHCLSDLHWSLCSIIHRTNSVFSWQLLAHVVTLLLHTIIAPYSLFTAMSLYTQGHLTDRYLGHLFMQAVWAVKHWVQLLLLVWPCSAATQEVRLHTYANDNSLDDNEPEVPVKRRKGVKQVRYKCEVIKEGRVKDESYTNWKGNRVERKRKGEDCKCSMKCFERVDEGNIKEINDRFYSFGSKHEQDAYLQSNYSP